MRVRDPLKQSGHYSYEFTDLDFLKVEPHSEELVQETWDKYQFVRRLIDLAPQERTDTESGRLLVGKRQVIGKIRAASSS